ncbi:hypothetical protein EYF80_015968 [Liparis tanakae]|uniref:Uncharacterized protein n=1 Tax=Liparis tanakae TaxID=230148 RepID=A0A4Z2I7E6_9TELE|nr:hypothetical protein EYF80_015968 [Liparis tanakae]
METSVVETSVVEISLVETLVVETSVVETLVVETSVVDTLVVKTSVVELADSVDHVMTGDSAAELHPGGVETGVLDTETSSDVDKDSVLVGNVSLTVGSNTAAAPGEVMGGNLEVTSDSVADEGRCGELMLLVSVVEEFRSDSMAYTTDAPHSRARYVFMWSGIVVVSEITEKVQCKRFG